MNSHATSSPSKQSDFFELIANYTFDLITLLGDDGSILYLNRAAINLFGHDYDKIVSESILDYIHPEDRSKVKENFQRLLSSPDEEITIEIRVLHSNGSWRWIEAKGQNLLYEEQLNGILVNGRDTTEKKAQEFEISQLNKRLELAFQSGVMAWWEMELPSGNVKFHENKVKMLGHKKEDFSHYTHFMDLVHPDDYEKTMQAMRDHVARKIPLFECTYRIRDISGNYVWYRDIGKVTYRKGDYLLVNGIAADLSEEKKTEGDLRKKAEKYRNMNANKSKLFSIISHDLRNPLSAIIGFSDLALVNLKKDRNDRVEKYIQIVKDSARNDLNLLNNLLDWSALQTGMVDFNPQQFKLRETIDTLVNFTTANAYIKEISFTIDVDDDLEVYADRIMLDTVLRNLISNAIKFTKDKGKIILSAKEEENGLIISIEDNGIGIEPDKVKQLFNIDESFSSPGTHNEPGSGIGLFICKEFIELHGGKIWVDTEVNTGTKFSFTLKNKLQSSD